TEQGGINEFRPMDALFTKYFEISPFFLGTLRTQAARRAHKSTRLLSMAQWFSDIIVIVINLLSIFGHWQTGTRPRCQPTPVTAIMNKL
ncbi:hypothetical protein ACR2XR_26175, partial [Klebsiella pneumoniae]